MCKWLMHRARSLGLWTCVSVVAVVSLGIFLSVEYWDWLARQESPSATIRNAGLVTAALVAIVLAVWRSIIAQKQADTAERNLINEQFKSGVELLGHENTTVGNQGL